MIIGFKDKTSSWHLDGFPDGSNIGSTVRCRGEAHRYTLHLHQSPCRDTKKKSFNKNIVTYSTTKTNQKQCTVVVNVCVFSSHSFWTSMDVPAGVTQEDTGFSIHLLSAVLALIFLARRIQPFLSLVDRDVEFCVLTIQSFSTRWAFLFSFLSF